MQKHYSITKLLSVWYEAEIPCQEPFVHVLGFLLLLSIIIKVGFECAKLHGYVSMMWIAVSEIFGVIREDSRCCA